MKLRPPPPFAPRPRDEQFLAVVTWQRIHLADEKLHEIFDTLDTEGLGYLTAETIQAAVGVDFGPEQIAQMIAEADADHDGRVDYAEFARVLHETQVTAHAERLAPVLRRGPSWMSLACDCACAGMQT